MSIPKAHDGHVSKHMSQQMAGLMAQKKCQKTCHHMTEHMSETHATRFVRVRVRPDDKTKCTTFQTCPSFVRNHTRLEARANARTLYPRTLHVSGSIHPSPFLSAYWRHMVHKSGVIMNYHASALLCPTTTPHLGRRQANLFAPPSLS